MTTDIRTEIEKAMARATDNAYDDLINDGDSDYLSGQMDAFQTVLDLLDT